MDDRAGSEGCLVIMQFGQDLVDELLGQTRSRGPAHIDGVLKRGGGRAIAGNRILSVVINRESQALTTRLQASTSPV